MADTSIKHDNYTSDDIQVLEGLEAVEKDLECTLAQLQLPDSTIWCGK